MAAASAGRGLRSVFQPIVSLPDERVVGYEALSRWPGMNVGAPTDVFEHAARTGAADRLDQLCIDSAIDTARRGSLGRGALLCINCEASTSYRGPPVGEVPDRRTEGLQVVFELTERGLLTHPHALLRKVAALRKHGFRIALDDIGAHPDSLALLCVVCPDVIKLDMELVQDQPQYGQARMLAAVLAYQERTSAVIIAEGIETDEHLEQALALGATLGQGYKFGRPAASNSAMSSAWSPPLLQQATPVVAGSPFDLVSAEMPVRTARKATLMAFSRQIESQAGYGAETSIVLTALQHDKHFTGATLRNYQELSDRCPLIAVFGKNLPNELGRGVRGVALDPNDPLCREWTVVVLGANTAAALIAREQEPSAVTGADCDRRFDFVMSYDRSLVTAAARNLLDRMG
ncbi:MAG: EAL domain-containing protein [Actinomycetia bacterium]|nr:EAL domain-containing protein [Actinomycetes bacterium]